MGEVGGLLCHYGPLLKLVLLFAFVCVRCSVLVYGWCVLGVCLC